MRRSVVSLSRKLIAVLAALALTLPMAPVAWAEEGHATTAASMAAGDAKAIESPSAAMASDPHDAPTASVRSGDTMAADGGGVGITTMKIETYRSSYPLVWDLNDAGSADETKAQWGNRPAAWPTEGSPGSAVGTCDGYVPWTDDANPGSEPSRLGFSFGGWSTDPAIAAEGMGKLDTLALPKDAPIVEGDDGVKRITLYALWAPVEYSVVFDLAKNPEDASAVPSFVWTPSKGTLSDLGGGRYRLSGVTLQDYDPATDLIEIATPARGSGGYRFLSWIQPGSTEDPAVAVRKMGSSAWYVNPVALPHYAYEPVLTARWALSFDMDVPSQVTFDQYDSLEMDGNLTDTTSKDVIDDQSPDVHDAGKRAHFCSRSTASDYRIVSLVSERQEAAADILTTSDSSKASQEEVLRDEKLLSLFAEGAASESQGVHFKLDDAIDMDDSTRYGAFIIPKQAKAYSDSDYSRDDEERLYVSYRLNLSNLVDGALEPNHGLVTPGNVNEGDRTSIAKVRYEFAVADADADEPFYITDVDGTTYGIDYIEQAAADLSVRGAQSAYHDQFEGWLGAQVTTNGNPGAGPYFQLEVDGIYLPVQLIGICQDTKSDGTGKAGLTFQMRDIYACGNTRSTAAGGGALDTYMNPSSASSGGWDSTAMRSTLRSTFWGYLPTEVRGAIVGVDKYQQLPDGTTNAYLQRTTGETVWLPSMHEVFGTSYANYNDSEALTGISGYVPFQYMAYQGNSSGSNTRVVKTYDGAADYWWLRSAFCGTTYSFCGVSLDGARYSNYFGSPDGMAPCFCL